MDSNLVKIGDTKVGDECPCYVVAEIGINHNGLLSIAKELIDAAVECGCNAVKFQKRTVEVVYTPEELAQPRKTPFGTTNGDLKYGLEFDYDEYSEIDRYCKKKGIEWFASCWDEKSVDFIDKFNPPCYKIASASITNDNLLKHNKKCSRPLIISTGMSDLPIIEHAVDIVGTENVILLHCISTYPSKLEELNLKGIHTLNNKFPRIPVGYSGHEVGLVTTIAAKVLGACLVERHITLDRAMWGSDQAASVEPQGMKRIVRDIRAIEAAMGDGNVVIYDSEKPIIDKLRRI